MSSFQFGFNFDNHENNDTTTINSDSHHKYDHTRERRSTSSMHVVHMQEIITAHLPSLNNLAQWKHDVIQIGPNDSLKRIHPSEKPFSQSDSRHRLDETSDLISGVYEGGLKVWECSIDLCHYLSEHVLSHDVINPISSLHRGGSILELGCGHGLPACLVLKYIMKYRQTTQTMDTNHDPLVIFTDYNDCVLSDVTLPNMILNTTSNDDGIVSKEQLDFLNRCTTLISGDWFNLMDTMKSLQIPQSVHDTSNHSYGKLDLILAAETTYSLESSQDTAYLLLHHLKPNGIGLVACKRYYFGVGGGSDEFVKAAKGLVLKEDGVEWNLQLELVRQYNDGKSNIRDLWKVTMVSSNA